jgi:hypothetical protein
MVYIVLLFCLQAAGMTVSHTFLASEVKDDMVTVSPEMSYLKYTVIF